jgi:hypothetical protein
MLPGSHQYLCTVLFKNRLWYLLRERRLHQEKGCRKASPATEASPLRDSSRCFQDAPERETCLCSKNQMENQTGTPVSQVDFLLEDHGSIFLLSPQTDSACTWIDKHISREGFQPYWPVVVIEHRYISDIVEGIQNDGLVVS